MHGPSALMRALNLILPKSVVAADLVGLLLYGAEGRGVALWVALM
jgi:hypothetical protein